MNMINVEVNKNENETNASLIRRFTRRVQSSGVLQSARKKRFFARPLSPKVKKQQKLRYLRKKEKMQELAKLGKI